jgi:pimeloyl-ACP methyl ester carboxylesterase
MATFTHSGVRFWYEQIGSGRPIVLGHGLTADVEQIKQMVGEIPGWQLIVWDCRGHGRTEPDLPTTQFGFDIFANDLAALLDHLQVARSVIGGLSMGAGVAARFAAEHPGRTDAVALLRPAWTNQPHPPSLALIERIGRMLLEVGPVETERWIDDPAGLRSIAVVSSEMLEGLRQQCRKPRARERSARLTVMPSQAPISGEQWISKLASIPALVTFCPQDPIHPPETAKWWADRLPKSTLCELPERAAPGDAHRLELQRCLVRFLESL